MDGGYGKSCDRLIKRENGFFFCSWVNGTERFWWGGVLGVFGDKKKALLSFLCLQQPQNIWTKKKVIFFSTSLFSDKLFLESLNPH